MPDFATLRAALPPVLRAWHRMDFPIDAWNGAVYLTEHLHSDLAVTPTELRREHVCAMIDAALHNLAARNPEAERLLRMRYLRHRQRGEVANQQRGKRGAKPLGQVKYVQAQALDALTHEVALLRIEQLAEATGLEPSAALAAMAELVRQAQRGVRGDRPPAMHNPVVVHDLYVVRVTAAPHEANAPALVDAYAVLPLPAARCGADGSAYIASYASSLPRSR